MILRITSERRPEQLKPLRQTPGLNVRMGIAQGLRLNACLRFFTLLNQSFDLPDSAEKRFVLRTVTTENRQRPVRGTKIAPPQLVERLLFKLRFNRHRSLGYRARELSSTQDSSHRGHEVVTPV